MAINLILYIAICKIVAMASMVTYFVSRLFGVDEDDDWYTKNSGKICIISIIVAIIMITLNNVLYIPE